MPPTASGRAVPAVRDPRALLPALVLLLTLAVGLAGAPPAAAHAALVSSQPAAGEQVDAVPTEVVLRFNEKIAAGLALVKVTDGGGLAITTGAAQVSGEAVTQQLRPDLAAGEYGVRFKVTSADGHPISDTFSFTIPDDVAAAEGAPSEAATPSSGAVATTGSASDPTGSAASAASATASAMATPAAGANNSSGPGTTVTPRAQAITTLWLILVLAILALVTALAVIAWRGRKARGVHGAQGRFD